jgi:putative DNA primase/helicase
LLRQNPNGLLVHRDEMISLLSHLDREENQSQRGLFMTAWNGNSSYTVDRIGRGFNRSVSGLCLSLLGAATPDGVQRYLTQQSGEQRRDDGLAQRFGLLVWPDLPSSWRHIDARPDPDAARTAYQVFERLSKIDLAEIRAIQDTDPVERLPDGLPYLRYSIDAYDAFVVWRTGLEKRLRGDDLHPAMQSHLAKYRKLVPALSLICHLAEGGTGAVDIAALRRAIGWASYLESHAARVYGSGNATANATARIILAKLKAGDLPKKFTAREVWRHQWSRLTDIGAIQAGLTLLVDFGYLVEQAIKTGGRPSTRYVF